MRGGSYCPRAGAWFSPDRRHRPACARSGGVERSVLLWQPKGNVNRKARALVAAAASGRRGRRARLIVGLHA